MAKIKHIALTTHNLEEVASFYKDAFGMAEVGTRLTPLDAAERYGRPSRGQRLSQAEVELRGPDGVIIDISESGWVGNPL